MTNNALDVRVYPIDEPKGNTFAFASIAINDLAAIRGVRVVNGEKGLFVTMPQSKDSTGVYRDIAFPLSGDLRKEIGAAVLDEFERQKDMPSDQRGYEKPETMASSRSAEDTKLDVKVFPVAEPKGGTLAFASIGLDNIAAIRGIRIVDSENGQFVSMPQSKDKEGNYHDVAFPLSGDLRRAISSAVLAEYKETAAQRRQSISSRLTEGAEQAAQYATNAPAKTAAKKQPGLGD